MNARSPRLHTAAAGFVLLLGTLALPAAGQTTVSVRGSVIRADGVSAAGVEVTLQIHDGTAIVHTSAGVADIDGLVEFAGMPAGSGHFARLGASFADVMYYSEPVALDGSASVVPVSVRVAPVTADGRPLHLDTLHIIVQAESATRFQVLQFLTVSNAGDAAWAGGPALEDGRLSGLTIPIPASAQDVRPAPFPTAAESLSADQMERGPDRVLDPRPVPPGGRQAAVTYLLDAESGPLEIALALPYPTQSISLLLGGAGAASVVLDRTNLVQRPAERIGDEEYEMWSAEALAPGAEVRFRIGPASEPLLPAYGWALAGLGLALLVATLGGTLAVPREHDLRLRTGLLEAIAKLDIAHERHELTPAEYHLARSRELERLLLLEERLAPLKSVSGARAEG